MHNHQKIDERELFSQEDAKTLQDPEKLSGHWLLSNLL